jgi:hypothetical protein
MGRTRRGVGLGYKPKDFYKICKSQLYADVEYWLYATKDP